MRPSRSTVVFLAALIAIGVVLAVGYRGGFGGLEKCGADSAASCVRISTAVATAIWLGFIASLALPLGLQAREWLRGRVAPSADLQAH